MQSPNSYIYFIFELSNLRYLSGTEATTRYSTEYSWTRLTNYVNFLLYCVYTLTLLSAADSDEACTLYACCKMANKCLGKRQLNEIEWNRMISMFLAGQKTVVTHCTPHGCDAASKRKCTQAHNCRQIEITFSDRHDKYIITCWLSLVCVCVLGERMNFGAKCAHAMRAHQAKNAFDFLFCAFILFFFSLHFKNSKLKERKKKIMTQRLNAATSIRWPEIDPEHKYWLNWLWSRFDTYSFFCFTWNDFVEHCLFARKHSITLECP